MLCRVYAFCFAFVCLSVGFASAQSSPVDSARAVSWTVEKQHHSPTQFTLIFRADIAKGWYVYDSQTNIAEVDSVTFVFNDAQIQPVSVDKSSLHIERIRDKVFDKTATVLVGKNVWKVNFSFASVDNVPSVLSCVVNYNAASAHNEFVTEQFHQDLALNGSPVTSRSLRVPSIDLQHPEVHFAAGAQATGAGTQTAGNWEIFALGFLGGLLALLTPCVFPMIPLTISFFAKSAQSRRESIRHSFVYGGSIVGIYAGLSLPFHLLDKLNPNILNTVATSPWLNFAFFVLFVVFALSFFGLFEITLPSSLGNMADSRSRSRKRLGIFFMALTLCIVSFSCTGPILGSLLAGSLSNTQGGATALTWGLLGFGIALAMPFTVLAFFPHSLSALPKSGGWMNTFKVSLGFFELAFALKFLSNADLIWHWGIIKREVFVFLWAALGMAYALYLYGVIGIDGREKHISLVRKLWAGAVCAFTVYLLAALPPKPWSTLQLLSGFPPPEFYSIYQQHNECSLGLPCEKDYFVAVEKAKQTNKPMLIDFTGWACVNCRKMEENVWVDPKVYALIRDKFILVSLYVDDRKKLPADQQIRSYTTTDGLEVSVQTVGEKWSLFETENFKNNAQPLYAIVSPQEKLLITPVGYLPDVAQYTKWLEKGLETMRR